MTDRCARVLQDRWSKKWIAYLWTSDGDLRAKVEHTWAEAFAWASWWVS